MNESISNSPERIAVAMVSPAWPGTASANGIATYTQNLVPSLRREGMDVYVMSRFVESGCQDDFVQPLAPTAGKPNWLKNPIRSLTMRVAPQYDLKKRVSRSILGGLGALRGRVNLRLLEMEESLGIAPFVTPHAQMPVVVRMHGPWFIVGPLVGAVEDKHFAARNRAERLALQKAAAVSAPSLDVMRRAREFFGLELKDAAVIPNPCPIYDQQAHWKLDRSTPGEILFVGRFDNCKGADVLIDAFVKIACQLPDARLVFVGPDNGLTDDAGRKWQIEPYAAEKLKDLRGRMQYLGKRSAQEIEELRRRARVTVICSRYENFPMVALEAMSMGCPLVASAVGGLAEMIQDGKNGLLARPGDADDLAKKIMTLLAEPQLADSLARQASIDCVQRYHPSAVARQMAEFYREVIARWDRQHAGSRNERISRSAPLQPLTRAVAANKP